MGIGAYECREYIRELGGRIEVASVPGQGTSFSIHIPVEAGRQTIGHLTQGEIA